MNPSSLAHVIGAVALLAACASQPALETPRGAEPAPPTPSTALPGEASATTARPLPSPPSAASSGATERPPPPPPVAKPVHVLDFTRVLAGPVKSLAVGIEGRAAALKDEPWLFDGKTWQELPIPAALRPPEGASDEVQIWFGRDNRPRLMGTRASATSTGFVYLRYKHGWVEAHREIGSLANKPHRALFGILGHDDPEVVCKQDDICIIKRLTGWTIIPSGPGTPTVVIAQKSAWALHDDHIAEVGDKSWRRLPALPFGAPRGLWADVSKHLYVSAGDALHHFNGETWKRHDAPVKTPRAVWGRSPTDVWVVGDDGAGHFDGTAWRKVAGVDGPLAFVIGTEDAVWLAGAAGVWRGVGGP